MKTIAKPLSEHEPAEHMKLARRVIKIYIDALDEELQDFELPDHKWLELCEILNNAELKTLARLDKPKKKTSV